LAVPIYDMVTVIAIRLRQGQSPFHADKQHLSHRLTNLGLSQAQAVKCILLTGAAIGISGLNLGRFLPWAALLTAASGWAILLATEFVVRRVTHRNVMEPATTRAENG
jgi:UDP-GlcNAc:undecaprenyl-phosphate GlcNAc-1-phosphate transferase